MSEAAKVRWPWLTLPRAFAILVLPGIIFMLLAWYFDTVWWRDLVSFSKSKVWFRVF